MKDRKPMYSLLVHSFVCIVVLDKLFLLRLCERWVAYFNTIPWKGVLECGVVLCTLTNELNHYSRKY